MRSIVTIGGANLRAISLARPQVDGDTYARDAEGSSAKVAPTRGGDTPSA